MAASPSTDTGTRFELLQPPGAAVPDPVAPDLELLDRLRRLPAQAAPLARLWTAPEALVVPRSYQRYAALDTARAQLAAQGCPVHLRHSGGGLVPQGPGILNLSLAYRAPAAPGACFELVYRHLCGLLQAGLRTLGLDAHWQPVPGSFCDGRFNLALGRGSQARKIAGSAQYWRQLPRPAGAALRHAVLAHAVLLVAPDLARIHARANAFERALGSGQRYDVDKTTSVASALSARRDAALMAEVCAALAEATQRACPPAVAAPGQAQMPSFSRAM